MYLKRHSVHIRRFVVIFWPGIVLMFIGIACGLYSNDTSFMSYRDSALPEYLEIAPKREQTIRRRPKRYVAFPEGSSFTCAVCATVGVVGSPRYNYLSYGLNWGIAYDLPNETWIINHLHGFGSHIGEPTAILKRRNRRALYGSIEDIIDRMGYNGRDCILRALCESKQFFQSEKLGMVPELLKTIFSLPKTRLFTRELQEHSDIELYNRAYFSDEYEDCELKYPCSFSLLELGMGKYSDPQPDYYDNNENGR